MLIVYIITTETIESAITEVRKFWLKFYGGCPQKKILQSFWEKPLPTSTILMVHNHFWQLRDPTYMEIFQ